jgi:hypothetical protein
MKYLEEETQKSIKKFNSQLSITSYMRSFLIGEIIGFDKLYL